MMGLDRATRKDVRPTRGELARMEPMLEEALDAGFVGMSSQQLLFDKTRRRDLPVAHAAVDLRHGARTSPLELAILRRRGTESCSRAPTSRTRSPWFRSCVASLGVGRRRLKTSLLSAADVKSLPAGHLSDGRAGADVNAARRRLPLAASAGAVRGVRRRISTW